MNLGSNDKVTAALAFGLSFSSLGLPYWALDYTQLTLPNSLFGIGLIVLLCAAIYLRGIAKLPIQDVVVILGLVPTSVVVVRIVIDVFLVPDSHNLWPFEIIIAGLLGLIVAGLGAALGSIVKRIRPNPESKDPVKGDDQ